MASDGLPASRWRQRRLVGWDVSAIWVVARIAPHLCLSVCLLMSCLPAGSVLAAPSNNKPSGGKLRE
ncbi:hypothetical protein MTO96_007955 [Rhipicephalus appendiculatus]